MTKVKSFNFLFAHGFYKERGWASKMYRSLVKKGGQRRKPQNKL
jgi:hypothetical protein